jgi:DNA invertase Pin-like site-specific DNA recombinase
LTKPATISKYGPDLDFVGSYIYPDGSSFSLLRTEAIMKVALYARVSTVDKEQNPEVQLGPLREYCRRMGWEIYKEYVDYASGADLLRRKGWAQIMKEASCREFDVILVWKTDRAFRSSIHAHNSVMLLQKYGVNYCSYTEPSMNTNSPNGMFLFSIMAAYAEMERAQIRERVIAGMDYAKEHGTKSGLPVGRPRLSFNFTNICNAIRVSKGNYTNAARVLSEAQGSFVTPGFVFNRLKREADARGISREELLKEVMK